MECLMVQMGRCGPRSRTVESRRREPTKRREREVRDRTRYGGCGSRAALFALKESLSSPKRRWSHVTDRPVKFYGIMNWPEWPRAVAETSNKQKMPGAKVALGSPPSMRLSDGLREC